MRPLRQGHGAGRNGTMGVLGEAAVVRGRAWVRDSNRAQRWECGVQGWDSGDRERAVGTEMWPRGQRWVSGDRDEAVGAEMGLWGQRCGYEETDSVVGRDVPMVAEVGL